MYHYDRRQAARPIPIDKGQARQLARDIVKELPRRLHFRPDDMTGPLNRARGYRADWGFDVGEYHVKDVRGFPITVPVRVRAKASGDWKTRKWVSGGGINTRYNAPHGKAEGYARKMGFVLNLNPEHSPQGFLDNLESVEKELYSVIIHEVTHLHDLLLHDGDDHEDDDGTHYHNNPAELRSFMQQVADEVLEAADQIGRDSGSWGLGPSPSGDMIDILLERSKTWDRVKRTLNPANTKLMLKGVARALEDEWPSLLEKYKEDDL